LHLIFCYEICNIMEVKRVVSVFHVNFNISMLLTCMIICMYDINLCFFRILMSFLKKVPGSTGTWPSYRDCWDSQKADVLAFFSLVHQILILGLIAEERKLEGLHISTWTGLFIATQKRFLSDLRLSDPTEYCIFLPTVYVWHNELTYFHI